MSDPSSPDPPNSPLKANDLNFLRKQAKALTRAARAGDAAAIARVVAVFHEPPTASFALTQAQLVIAREAGFVSWPKLQDELRWRADVRKTHRLGSAAPIRSGATMSAHTSLKLGPIDQIGLSCTNLDEAHRFYAELLGLRLAGEVPGVMKFFACDGVNLVIFKNDSVPPNSIIYFKIPGEAGAIEEKVAQLKSKQIKVESDAHVIARNWDGCDVWMAFFRDPFGNLLALKSDVPVKAK